MPSDLIFQLLTEAYCLVESLCWMLWEYYQRTAYNLDDRPILSLPEHPPSTPVEIHDFDISKNTLKPCFWNGPTFQCDDPMRKNFWYQKKKWPELALPTVMLNVLLCANIRAMTSDPLNMSWYLLSQKHQANVFLHWKLPWGHYKQVPIPMDFLSTWSSMKRLFSIGWKMPTKEGVHIHHYCPKLATKVQDNQS